MNSRESFVSSLVILLRSLQSCSRTVHFLRNLQQVKKVVAVDVTYGLAVQILVPLTQELSSYVSHHFVSVSELGGYQIIIRWPSQIITMRMLQ